MKERLLAYAAKLDGLKFNERVLVLGASILVLGGAWSEFLMSPLELERRVFANQIAQNESKLAELDAEALRIVEVSKRDPNEPLRKQIQQTKAQIKGLEAEIRELAGQLIDPQEMAQVLRRVLENTHGLEFVSLEGLGAEPLLETSNEAPKRKTNGARTAFRHGFRVRFTGSYLDTIAYMRALEVLPWKFFWEAVDINVKIHPTAETSIVVYTLSLDRSWIGV
ncbi:MAG: hypothetical protein O7B81_01610 [Gammaproteobacteria bacterium]|nr:hypothetical protein [Gammaproteobacteria bacterium]